VASREPTKKKAPEVRTMFEPSRLALACLAQAYERVVPITRRTALPAARRPLGHTENKRRAGGSQR